MGRQDDSPEHQLLSQSSGRTSDAVRMHRMKSFVPGWCQDSGWNQSQIRTQRRIDLASLFAINVLSVRCVRGTGRTRRMLVVLMMTRVAGNLANLKAPLADETITEFVYKQ